MRAIGHRVVHGKSIDRALLVDQGVIDAIEEASDLAPLHNPGMQSLRQLRDAKQARRQVPW